MLQLASQQGQKMGNQRRVTEPAFSDRDKKSDKAVEKTVANKYL